MINRKILLSGVCEAELVQDQTRSSLIPLLDIAACGICATDRKAFLAPPASMKLPLVPGHEFCGTHLLTGKRVVVWPAINCGHCDLCCRGQSNLCKDIQLFGLHLDGGYQLRFSLDHSLVEKAVFIDIPSRISWNQATMAEPLGCVIHSLGLIQKTPETVCIYGAGLMGRLAARLVQHKWPDSFVEVLDPDPLRQELAGETRIRGGVDLAFMACSSAQAVSDALLRLKPGGDMVMFSGLERDCNPIPIDYNRIHRLEQTLHGSYGCLSEDMKQALDLMAEGSIVVEDLISSVVSLEQVPEILVETGNSEEFKTIITIQ